MVRPRWPRPFHDLVLGIPGSGKSTLARAIARRDRRVVYYDPAGDYERERGAWVVTPDEPFADIFERERYARVVVIGERGDVDPAEEVHDVAAEARRAGNLLLVLDEVGDYKLQAELSLKRLHRNGHKQGVRSLMVSQRATDIPAGCRATASRVYSLRQTSRDDLDALAREYGDEYAEEVSRWEAGDPPVVWERPALWGDREHR